MTEPSYLYLRQLGDGETVHRTVAIGNNLNVDVDGHGWILGIERVSGPVDFSDLVAILGATLFTPQPVDTANTRWQQLAATAQPPPARSEPPSSPPVSSGSPWTPPGKAHAYCSTACLHQLHGKCRRTCKYCGEPCWCACHGKELATGGIITAPIHIGHAGCVIDPMSETTLGISPTERSPQ